MNNKQSDLQFSVKIIQASAGTGKTYRLTREFINLLTPENVLETVKRFIAITFSEKAACEMRMRILEAIMREIAPNLSDETRLELENLLFLMRVSTIHSFCRSLLKRFGFLAGIDRSFKIAESAVADILFGKAVFSFLESAPEMPVLAQEFTLRTVTRFLETLRRTHPHVFLGSPVDDPKMVALRDCYSNVMQRFSRLKSEQGILDFDDLEEKTYTIIREHPEALNILYDFDESVDHIFVDEFQDTNLLQWDILREFTGEWISGYGAKADTGRRYGVFLVGDKKQSIYDFRGAESSVFEEAKKFFGKYVVEDYLTTSRRSFPAIIDFINQVFAGSIDRREQLVVCEQLKDRKEAFVEIKFFENTRNITRDRKTEFEWVVKRIYDLLKSGYMIRNKQDGSFAPVRLRDIAVMMRKRTHLALLENTFARYRVPYVNVGGIGFYSTDEIAFLISLVCALIDPSDTVADWNVRHSVFEISWDFINHQRKQLRNEFLTDVLENILREINISQHLDSQALANVEKFMMILHSMETLPHFQVSANLRRMMRSEIEPKADIFSGQADAVRVLTVHAAKGLEFPVVFLIAADMGKVDKRLVEIVYERGGTSEYIYSIKKMADSAFQERFIKNLEEQEERLLYVALTRAQQALVISGRVSDCVWLKRLLPFESKYPAKEVAEIEPQFAQGAEKIREDRKTPCAKSVMPRSFSGSSKKTVTGGESDIVGQIIHEVAADIGRGIIAPSPQRVTEKAISYFKKARPDKEPTVVLKHAEHLLLPEILNVIVPQKGAFSELPFLANCHGTLIQGYIDRVLVDDTRVRIYDFKTRMNPEILPEDRKQLSLYSDAVKEIFPGRKIEKFLIFTYCGIILKVKQRIHPTRSS